MRKVLVTGAAGFVGSTLAEALTSDSDVKVIGVDALTDYYDPAAKRQNLSTLSERPNFQFVEADLNALDLSTLLDGVTEVYHQAGQPGVRSSWGEEFATYMAHNIQATQSLLEAAKSASQLKAFVYASSSSVYGDAERFPTEETDRPAPRSPYGVTKLAAEHLCSLYAANFGIPTVSLRYFTVYGPRQRPDMAFRRFLTAAVADETIHVYGSGEQIREFTHIHDIVRANLLAGETTVPAGTVINLSGGASVSVNETLDVISDLVGRPLRIERSGAVAGDVLRTGGSTQRAAELLGWQAQVDIRAGLASELDWVLQTRWSPAA